jgi:HNH endonuclease
MKTKIPNALIVWKQFEDVLAPRLGLSTADRAVYCHLVRHSRLEGKVRIRFSMDWMARGMGFCRETGRDALRRLGNLGILRLIERGKAGHLVEVRLPDEIRAIRSHLRKAGNAAPQPAAVNLEKLDFFKNPALRQAIHARERGVCFYCLRRTSARKLCLDHVVPRAKQGRNTYRNLVSCCMECNTGKCERSAADHLSKLYREGRLTDAQLTSRFRAVDALASGKLRPTLPAKSCPAPDRPAFT